MAKKLTQEEFKQRVFDCVGPKYSVISEYQGKNKPVDFKCNIHNIVFTATAECFMRGPEKINASCPECLKEKRNKIFSSNRTEVECAYCGKKFLKPNSKLDCSKSGLYFCCREHKDLAQQINFGLEEIWPTHYDTLKPSISTYRPFAFRNYKHECAVCGWQEDEDILEVHHIDENRDNNNLENLIILCPTCHRKLSSHKYLLIERKEIVLKPSILNLVERA